MLVTPRFVFVHLPKTGGTFVESILARLHPPARRELPLRIARKLGLPVTVELPKHGTWRDVPQPYRGLPVLTCVRHPLDHYVSIFRYRRHHAHPEHFGGANPEIRRRWPNFPELPFDRFVEFLCTEATFLRFPGFAPDDQPGLMTQHLLYFFARNLEATVRDLTPNAGRDGSLAAMLPELHALHTHRLSEQLHAYLARLGYPDRRIGHIRDAPRILPEGSSRPEGDDWRAYYPSALEAEVRRRERLVFELFPGLDAREPDAYAQGRDTAAPPPRSAVRSRAA